jgi:hypothetical protein
MTSKEQINESRILAGRLCLNPAIVLKWMKANDLYTVLDVKNHCRGKGHSESMDQIIREIWDMAS